MLTCEICGKNFKHLGSHVAKAHKMTAKEYKMEFGLDIKHSLITEEIKRKKQEAWQEGREKYLANLEKGKKYRFKKGQVARHYYSQESLERAIENLEKIRSREAINCPFCNLKTHHLESHIFNAHGYIKVRKKYK